jgi:hypothetical protein
VKRGSEYFAVPTHDRDVVLPNASYPGSFEGLLRSLEGTAEFETFRPFVMEPDNGVNEDETRSSTAAPKRRACCRATASVLPSLRILPGL